MTETQTLRLIQLVALEAIVVICVVWHDR